MIDDNQQKQTDAVQQLNPELVSAVTTDRKSVV